MTTPTATRTVLRYPLFRDTANDVETVKVGQNAEVRYVGEGTSPNISAWVEVDRDSEPTVSMTFAAYRTNEDVPADAVYLGVSRSMGMRFLYLIPTPVAEPTAE